MGSLRVRYGNRLKIGIMYVLLKCTNNSSTSNIQNKTCILSARFITVIIVLMIIIMIIDRLSVMGTRGMVIMDYILLLHILFL